MCCGGTLQTMRLTPVRPPSISSVSRAARSSAPVPRCRSVFGCGCGSPRPPRRVEQERDFFPGRLPRKLVALACALASIRVDSQLTYTPASRMLSEERSGRGRRIAQPTTPRGLRIQHGGSARAAARRGEDNHRAIAQRGEGGDQEPERDVHRLHTVDAPSSWRASAPARLHGPGAKSKFARRRRWPAGRGCLDAATKRRVEEMLHRSDRCSARGPPRGRQTCTVSRILLHHAKETIRQEDPATDPVLADEQRANDSRASRLLHARRPKSASAAMVAATTK